MQSINETLDMEMSPQPTKRRRSSILKAVDRRPINRDSRTVSFNITKFLADEDMEITTMELPRNETITSSIDMSMDETLVPEDNLNVTLRDKTRNTTADISTDTLIPDNLEKTIHNQSNVITNQSNANINQSNAKINQSNTNNNHSNVNNNQSYTTNNNQSGINNNQSNMNQSSASTNTTLDQTANMETSMSTTANSCSIINNTSIRNATVNNTSINMVANINTSLPHGCTLDENDMLDDDTLFGAFHDSNNMSFVSTRTSGFDTLMLNMDALTDRYQKVEHDMEVCRQRLDSEIDELFKFYRHVVNKDDRYEFAIAILGLRHSLWLWFTINPETYPNEKLNVRIVSHKRDRNLYPLKDYAKIVSRFTKEGHHGYLTKFVINAQRFRRLLRKVGYGRAN